MGDFSGASERETRLAVFNSYKDVFASAPIRLMSRTVSKMRSLGYADLASAIGDLDWRTVPADDPEDPTLRHDWNSLLNAAFEHVGAWLRQLSAHPMGYNLDSIGYPAVSRSWAGLWSHQLGIDFEPAAGASPEVYVFHGGNQALQSALLGISEHRRDRVGIGRPARVALPLPTFSCPLDQLALQGMHVHYIPPGRPDLDPSPEDLKSIPEGTDIDGFYVMPINNPTGRTLEPAKMKAFVDAVLERWPHAGIVMDSVYVRLHPRHRELLSWYDGSKKYDESIIFVDSLSKSHGVTGLRAGALLTRSRKFSKGVVRYAQNVMAGPSNAMQAVMLSLLAPFVTGDDELADNRIRLQLRIGRHLKRRRRLLLQEAFSNHSHLLDSEQPVIPDPFGFNWDGSMYADLRLSDECIEIAEKTGVSPTVAFYLETGIGGVPLDGFCRNPNLERHGMVLNADDPKLEAFVKSASRYVRLSFGMTPPPRVGAG